MGPLEPTLIDFGHLGLDSHWGVDLVHHLPTLVGPACQHILLHLELEAAVVPQHHLPLPFGVLGHHQRRTALLTAHRVASPVLGELLE